MRADTTVFSERRKGDTRRRLIQLLGRSNGFVSGETLSRRLHITRAAVWKHIHQLIAEGYVIAHDRCGYRLVVKPDGLPEAIRTKKRWGYGVVGRSVRYHDCLTSTMDEVFRCAHEENADEGLVVVAGRQTQGRGQRGRLWVSLKDSGLYFSLLLRPRQSPRCAVPLTLLGAVAVAKTVKELTGVTVDLKWPNDVVWQNRKLAGVLVEMRSTTDEVDVLVMGIGINVHHAPLEAVACCLKDLGSKEMDRAVVLQRLLRELGRGYETFQRKGSQPLINQWRQWSRCWNRPVQVRVDARGPWQRGEIIDVNEDGALCVRCTQGGEIVTIYSSAQLKWIP